MRTKKINSSVCFKKKVKRILLQFSVTKYSFSPTRITISQEGDYRICWDNTFSHFSTKTVFFGITIESDDDDDLWDDGLDETITAEEIYEMKIEDIKVGMPIWTFSLCILQSF